MRGSHNLQLPVYVLLAALLLPLAASGRWISVDPKADKYPSVSPYVYCANNPLRLVDRDGEEWYNVVGSRMVGHTWTQAEISDRRERMPGVVKVLESAGIMPGAGDKTMVREATWGVTWNTVGHQVMNAIPVIGFIHATGSEGITASSTISGTTTAIGFGSSAASQTVGLIGTAIDVVTSAYNIAFNLDNAALIAKFNELYGEHAVFNSLEEAQAAVKAAQDAVTNEQERGEADKEHQGGQ